MLESTMLLHDLTADEMEAKSVTVQAVPATVVVGVGVLFGATLTLVLSVVGTCHKLVSVQTPRRAVTYRRADSQDRWQQGRTWDEE